MLEKLLIDLLKRCADSYYNSGEYYKLNDDDIQYLKECNLYQEYWEPIYDNEVNDEIYDFIYNNVKKIYSDNEYFKSVGIKERSLEKVDLPFVMGSMNEAKIGEIEKWLKPLNSYIWSIKLDGCSCGLVYENGELKEAYTRGDGKQGQLITETVKRFGNHLPKILGYLGRLEIRGEIIIPKNDIPLMIQELKEENGRTYKNGRNSVAGCLNAKIAPESFVKYAHFVAYHINGDFVSESGMFMALENLGFETPKYDLIYGDTKEEQLIKINEKYKKEYMYEMDGIIITKNHQDNEDKEFETGTLNPKCSRKFKVGCVDNYAISTITNIKWQVSSFGYLKPVIEINPVDLDGSTITFATGNNYKNVIDNKISIGSKIRIKKAGLVIPFIEEVVEYALEENYNLPPKEIWESNGVDIILSEYKESDDNTDEVLDIWTSYFKEMYLLQCVYFCTKMKIDFAGYGNIKRLADASDKEIYELHDLLLEDIDTFEEEIGVNGLKFYKSMKEKMKEMNPSVFFDAVSAFGRGIGELKLNKIIEKYGTLEVSYDQLLNVDGFAEKTAQQYIDNIMEYNFWKNFVESMGYILKYPTNNVVSNDLANLVVVFTGVRDKQMEEYIKSNGGKIATSCTKDVNMVITKDVNSSSSKIQKAKKQGAEIVSYEDAKRRFS